MRIWLNKNHEVPLREQLVTQIILGVVSNDLPAGRRLPSTREMARRYKIHSNTVSAAYRELARRRWVEFRRGSGVYVRPRDNNNLDESFELDALISKFFRNARDKGYPLAEIQNGLKRWLALQPPDHFLVVESDPELRAILMAEVEEATRARVAGASPDRLTAAELTGAAPLVLYGHLEAVRARLPPETDLTALRSRSVADSMRGEKAPSNDELVTVVSRWPEFLRWSKAMLVAAGVEADSLSLRDASSKGWKRALSTAALVITDSQTARELPPGLNVRVYRLISDASLKEVAEYARQL